MRRGDFKMKNNNKSVVPLLFLSCFDWDFCLIYIYSLSPLFIMRWPKEKVQKDRQRSTKHTHKTKDRETRTPLKTEHWSPSNFFLLIKL
jgi:hypothetical protein